MASQDDLLAGALHDEMSSRGYDARLRSPESSDPWPEVMSGLVLIAPPPAAGGDAAFASFAAAFDAGRAAAFSLNAVSGAPAVFASITRLGGRFGLDGAPSYAAALSAGLAGLVKSAAQEWPGVTCRALDASDCDDAASLARRLADEILASPTQARPLELGLEGEHAWTTVLRAAPLAWDEVRDEPLLAPRDLVVVSGGARGVTAAVVQRLAERYDASFLILGRSAEPGPEPAHLVGLTLDRELQAAILRAAGGKLTPRQLSEERERVLADREIRANLAALRASGRTALYRAADVRDAAVVADAVKEACAVAGPVRLLVHGAGVLQDRLIKDKTRAQVELVLGTKIGGLAALMAAVEPGELKGLVLFSSSTGRFGRKGQADYAVANEALNKIAQHYRASLPRCRVLSLNWGPWDGGMVTAALKGMFAAEGIEVIGLKAGSDLVVQELQKIPNAGPELVVLGAGSRAPGPLAPWRIEVSIGALPVLRDHVLAGRAVLPAALLLEYQVLAAMRQHQGLALRGCEDFRVLKGVTLAADDAVELTAACGDLTRRGDEWLCPVEIGAGGLPNARMTVVFGARAAASPVATIAAETISYDLSLGSVYERVLFHGPLLRCLREVRGLSASGATAVVDTGSGPGSFHATPPAAEWATQPLVIDGIFQLMILWSQTVRGARCLPAALGRLRLFGPGIDGPRCELRLSIRSTARGRAVADCEVLRADGSVAAAVEGFEATVEPALARAFRQNRLVEAEAR